MPTIIEDGFGDEKEAGKKTTRSRTVIEETTILNSEGTAKSADTRILAGFLYSFSRSEAGDYFPLFEGKNAIGNDPDADIPLPEQMVSAHHADLFVIKKQNEPQLDFRIKDAGSSNSTFCDGQQLFVGDVAILKERSVLNIGGYVLKVLLIDKFAEGMVLNPGFKPVSGNKRPKAEDVWEQVSMKGNKRRDPTT